jgi:KaiC/GvpD/RAD55 family RecA-like ATPase
MENKFLYSQYIQALLISINDAMINCINLDVAGKSEEIHEYNKDLIECFLDLGEEFNDLKGKDSHIMEGIGYSHRYKHNKTPRVLKLLINSYNETKEIRSQNSFIIPSPLNILYHLLIHPDYLNTAAYSLTSCRYLLFSILDLHTTHPLITDDSFLYYLDKQISVEEITDSIYSFNQNIKIQARWPRDISRATKNARKDCFVGHFLAMKGISFLWFKSSAEAIKFLNYTTCNKSVSIELKKAIETRRKIRKLIADKDSSRYRLVSEKDKLSNEEINELETKIIEKENSIKLEKKNTKLNTIEFLSVLQEKYLSARFRVSPKFENLPDNNQIINQIFSIPIPLSGADIIFFGGLQPASNGGLVIGVSGDAGSGKTSFALSLANYFSPYGTKTYYISLEEGIEDIKNRLLSLNPEFSRELSIFHKNEYFEGLKISNNSNFEDFNNQLNTLKNRLLEERKSKLKNIQNSFPAVCPLMIVIDNINELIKGINHEPNYELAENFINNCRKLNALVIVISSEVVMNKLQLDYLIDTGINLSYSGLESFDDKPIRRFKLYKTRHQLSRQGSHIFHMSGTEGFRISPQIHSQIDKKKKIRKSPQSEEKIINSLNIIESENSFLTVFESIGAGYTKNRDRYIKLYSNSNILIHGYGSSGKAAIALKILLTPPIATDITPKNIIDKVSFKIAKKEEHRKILIISFLYNETYYNRLIGTSGKTRLQNNISNLYKVRKPTVEYIILYPGNLTPNDFLNKVTNKLNSAIISGEPFNGVLIDGLHNVFIQFPLLQEAQSVWPTLQSILARYDVTVINTFTNFSINDKLVDDDKSIRNQVISQSLPDHLLIQKGMTPLLSMMVKATDYYIFTDQEHINGDIRHFLSIKGAIDQYIPTEILEWDRNKYSFINAYTQDSYQKMINEKKSNNLDCNLNEK